MTADWVDLYNRLYRERILFLGQQIDDELTNQLIGVMLYLDSEAQTADLLGVRRWPETLIYDPRGLLVHQAKGPLDWGSPALASQIQRAKNGVEEIQ